MGPVYDHQVGRWTPPDLPDRHIAIQRARRAHAQAMASLFGALFRAVATLAKDVMGFVRYAAHGATKMPPQGHYRITASSRLTGCCK